jgi:hypothetical protein
MPSPMPDVDPVISAVLPLNMLPLFAWGCRRALRNRRVLAARLSTLVPLPYSLKKNS